MIAPYAHGDTTGRQVKTQRENDMEAIELAGRKGVMLDQLAALADDDRLDSASRMKVEWFAGQVRDARTGGRLDNLADLFADAGIRARRWWQQTGAIDAGYADEYDDVEGQGADVIALPVPAAPAMTWPQAIAAHGWRLGPGIGTCPVIDEHGRQCTAGGTRPIALGSGTHRWLCQYHYGPLGAQILDANRARGIS